MTIDPSLMYAILSMDAYNRGYAAGIRVTESENPVNQQLGSATIITTSSTLLDENGNPNIDDNIGFYAIAYTYGNETIISFRGTDTFVLDPIHGWTLGAGNTSSQQGLMALQFYQAVANEFELPGSGNVLLDANISLTGHSLGGGLAGYVGAI